MIRDTYIEVNLDNLRFNMESLKERLGKDTEIAAVVKADAYGHGIIRCAKTLIESGAGYLAVATLSEALQIRKAYSDYPIFIMGYTADEYLHHIVENDITQCIFTLEQANILNGLGEKLGKKPKVHIKYDTGFNRIGFSDTEESIEAIKKIVELEHLDVEGIFSHLALAGDEENRRQTKAFLDAVGKVESSKGFKFKYKHVADSIAAIDYPEFCFDMVRPGALIYGMKSFRKNDIELKQVVSFKTKISYIKTLKNGDGVSYNYKYKTDRDTVLATIQVGYADGFPRDMYDVGEVTIHGKRAKVVGVICMDQCMVDVTDIPSVKVGDEVIIYGDESQNAVTIPEAAAKVGSNKNEILCRFTVRTPKVYIENGRIEKVVNYILD